MKHQPCLPQEAFPAADALRRRLLSGVVAAAAHTAAHTAALSAVLGRAGPAQAAQTLPDLLLAREYQPGVDLRRYLVSEKFDGVRAYWDGDRLRFRSGIEVVAPGWFLSSLPRIALDGELWLGRQRFESLVGTVRKAVPVDEAWREVRYLVFEMPQASGPFSQRVRRLQALVADASQPHLVAVAHEAVADEAALRRRLAEVVRGGGEGLMLHLADAPYGTGRSDALLKLKPWQDAEAVVLAHEPGRGRHAGRLGALRVRGEDGQIFLIGTGLTDAQRDHPPPVGAVVTYRYRGLTAQGKPRFATFWRMRVDD